MMRKTTKINNNKIEYIVRGSGDPLLFIHGGTVSYRTYLPFIDKLSEKFQVYALSLPGAGRSSSIPFRWNHLDYGHLVNSFVQEHEIKPIIAGHSYGGAVSVISKALYPESFNKVILFAPAGISVKAPSQAIIKVARKKFNTLLKGNRILKKDLLINNVLHFHDYARIGNSFSKMDISELMAQIQDDILLFWGEKDEIFSKDYAKHYTNQFQNVKEFWLDDGHGFLDNNSELLLDLIQTNL